jgi:hypothetical protein
MKPLESDAAFPLNAGASRRKKRLPTRFLRRFEPFQGFADRKISQPRIDRPADFPRTTPRTDAVSRLSSIRRDGPRIGVLRTGEDLAGFQFGFVCFQRLAGRKSSAPSQPAPRARRLDRCVALAKGAFRRPPTAARRRTAGCLLGRAAWAICDRRPRAADDSARGRRPRHAAAGFLGERGHSRFSSSEIGRRE